MVKLEIHGTMCTRQDRWNHNFLYEGGLLFWAVDLGTKIKIGDVAGFFNGSYLYVRLDGIAYPAHKIIWELHNGDTDSQIDHINRVKDDNRIENLRLATRSQNEANTGLRRNNSSGFKGVYFFKRTNRWRAKIDHDGREIHLGYYDSAEEAAMAYNSAAVKLKGKFALLNEIH